MAGDPIQRGSGRGRYRPMAEINVTPLVDVILVLLIVFMVAAPLMTSGVPVDLPKASATPLAQDSEPLTVSVNIEGKIFLQDTELTLSDLVPKLLALSGNKADHRVFVRGDKSVNYGRVMGVMAAITQGGFSKVALLAEQTGELPASSPTNMLNPVGSAPAGR